MDLFRFLKRKPKEIFPNQKHIIEPAFMVGGVQYYQFQDVFNIPCERGLMALAVYEETRMRCSREYLEKHVETVKEILHSSTIDVYKLNALNEQMRERLNLVLDTDLLYKLASIVFFDETENPAIWEYNQAKKKIELWQKHSSVAAFFLQKPLVELIPFLQKLDFDLDEYSEMNSHLNEIHSERLSLSNSKRQ